MKLFRKMTRTFRQGGIHPADDKFTAREPIVTLSLPAKVIIPLQQHAGKPAIPVVQPGDRVKAGTLIARLQGEISANIHSSVSGVVSAFEEHPDASGASIPSLVIEREGDEWTENMVTGDDLSSTPIPDRETILSRIREAGVVGMGGAAFPTHVKLRIPDSLVVDTLLINGVECEPFLTADHRLMLEKPDEILTGTAILMKALDIREAIIGIEANKQDAINVMARSAANFSGITVVSLEMKYPQGSEKQLIEALTDRRVEPGKLPATSGVLVNNVATTYAVFEAVIRQKPLVDRVVTVTGKSLSHPGNFLARIGTPVVELIRAAGGLPDNTGKVIAGGPMMGHALASLDVPVTKGLSGIVVLSREESPRSLPQTCIRCGKCVEGCPMNLEPYLLMAQSEKGLYEKALQNSLLCCMECGTCSYVCPAFRPVLDYIREGKKMSGKVAASTPARG